jgi:hydrogenase maturation protease
MTSAVQHEILLIGVGNLLRGDDAAGRLTANLIRSRNCPAFRVIEHGGEGASLMEAWAGVQDVIVVDVVSSNSPPGTIFRFDATKNPLQTKLFQNSTHSFGLQEAVELSRALDRLPRHLIVYGIQAQSFETGAPPSDEVQKAIQEVVARILQEPLVIRRSERALSLES